MSEEEKICVRVLINMITFAIKQITTMDAEYKAKIEPLNEITQWNIGDDISYYSEMKGTDIKLIEGKAPSPSLTIEIIDAPSALQMLTGQAPIQQMMVDKKFNVIGDQQRIPNVMFIFDTVNKYLGDMRQ